MKPAPNGLKGKKGNNQTKKGRNLRYVIQAREFRKGLVRGGGENETVAVETPWGFATYNEGGDPILPRHDSPLYRNP